MTLASSLFLASLPLLVNFYAEKYRLEDLNKSFPDDPEDLGLPIPETFDFVIVGGGTCGCVLANRLSLKYSVLVIEGGGNPPPVQDIPFTFINTIEFPLINYNYKSIPQANSGLKTGGIISTPTGRMIGGSSSHNGLIYQRGNPKDFDRWADVSGDKSWRYKHILKYFIKSEKYMGKLGLSRKQHGYNGTIETTEVAFSPGDDAWFSAGKELGYDNIDPNGPQKEGFYTTTITKTKRRRESTYTAYIKPIEKKRKNLKIYRYSFASEIIFDEHKRAIGVSYTRHGIPRVAFANKEVILSAGSYVSPLILIKSGIGPEDQLKAADVKPISILPVGKGLMDHPLIGLGPIFVDDPKYSWNIQPNLTFRDINKYVHHGKGPLSGIWQGRVGAYISSSHRPNWPDIQLMYSFCHQEPNSVKVSVGVQTSHSRGSVRLNTSATSMADDNLPIVDFNYFTNKNDLDVAVQGIKTVLKAIEETEAFKKIGARYGAPPYENCRHLKFRSDEYWKCYIRYKSETTWHPACTCRMGKGQGDSNAVVDSKLRVIGVKNLRVADASIMPFVTNANTHTPVVMIGEKLAAEILNDHESQQT